jgi:hypothetical protein
MPFYIFIALFREDWKNEQPEAFQNLKTLVIVVHHSDHKKLINKKIWKFLSYNDTNEPKVFAFEHENDNQFKSIPQKEQKLTQNCFLDEIQYKQF